MKPTLHTTDTNTVKRAGIIGVFIISAFAFLLLRILFYQTLGYEKYRDKVLNQITTEVEVVAERGKIYDRNGVLLATSVTTYRVFIAPRIVSQMSEEQGLKYDVLIATELTEFPTLCDTMDCGTPGFPVLQYLAEFAQTPVH